jgi:hypothetical protein
MLYLDFGLVAPLFPPHTIYILDRGKKRVAVHPGGEDEQEVQEHEDEK